MLKFFRHNYLLQMVVIVVMAMVTWLPVFLHGCDNIPVVSDKALLYNILIKLFDFAPWIVTALAFLSYVGSLFFLNTILSVNQLSLRNSSIAALTAVVCMAAVPITNEMFSFVLALPLILMVLHTIYALFMTEHPESYLFNVGLFISCASLLYYPSLILVVWVIVTMMVLGYKAIRLFFIPLLGLVTPYFILLSVCYMGGSLWEILPMYSEGFLGLEIHCVNFETQYVVTLIVEGVLLLLALYKISLEFRNKSVSVKTRSSVTILLLMFSVAMTFMQGAVAYNGMLFLMLSVVYAMALSVMKKSVIADVIVIILVICDVLVQYIPLFI